VVSKIKPEFETDKSPTIQYQPFWGEDMLVELKSGSQNLSPSKRGVKSLLFKQR
jgi:hypothetical protein